MSRSVRKKRIVFLPYKATMWDSLESIWRVAEADPDCEAYVVPIPYFERTATGALGQRHYEIDDFPADVPVIDNECFDLAKERPDIIYIHNPYDNNNAATSVDPRYYSETLRRQTPLLIYVPYYATSGGMMETQGYLVSYVNMDCIVIQAECLRRYFSKEIPTWKIQALGSPKFDKIIHCCQNPPSAPASWQAKMQGRKVYFYNTSLGGLLENTPRFLKKMRYVFETFKAHPEVCLIWRPHPLMEDSLRSMRPHSYQEFLDLRRQYIDEAWGIYDDTPEIASTIALCDVYVGDGGTSVTSLFGVAGKPLFILSNWLHQRPGPEDWRGELINFNPYASLNWLVTQNGNIYHAEKNDLNFSYYGHFSRYASAWYWNQVWEVGGKAYVCPANGQEILCLGDGSHKGQAEHIQLRPFEGQCGVFAGAWAVGKYLFLLPFHYPSLVRFDTETGELTYIDELHDNEGQATGELQAFFTRYEQGIWYVGGSNVWRNCLLLTAPLSNVVLVIDARTLHFKLITLPLLGGCSAITVHGDEVWFMPTFGSRVICWQPISGQTQVYDGLPQGFCCTNVVYGAETGQQPFSSAAFPDEQHVILAPCFGNMFVILDRCTGDMAEWETDFDCSLADMDNYYYTGTVGIFATQLEKNSCLYYHAKDRRLYRMDFKSMEADELPINFDREALQAHPAGFHELSEWLRYGCEESAFNTLEDLLTDSIHGGKFDRNKALAAFGEIAANIDGTSGAKIHAHAMKLLRAKGMVK